MSAIMYRDRIYGLGGAGGGGTSGNTISYGTDVPATAGNDGDLYILLDNNGKELGKYLFMVNEWVLISGREPFGGTIYDNGVEVVPISLGGQNNPGTKYDTYIQINTGGGTFRNYAITDDAVDVTDYNTLHVECYYRSQSYDMDFDISSYTGNKYISFVYLTDSSHNECAVGLADTKESATTFRVDSRNGGDGIQKLFVLELE